MTKFIPEFRVLKLSKVELKNILGFLQEDPKINKKTILKIKKHMEGRINEI